MVEAGADGTWNCTRSTPFNVPGMVLVVVVSGARFGSRKTTPGVSVTAGVAAAVPVVRFGASWPSPFANRVTVEPATAGLVQSFRVPSVFSAIAAGPMERVSPHCVQPGNRLVRPRH